MRRALLTGGLGALLGAGGGLAGMWLGPRLGQLGAALPNDIPGVLAWMLIFTWISATTNGGDACMRHLALRLVLWRAGLAPWNYAAFLNHASDILLLRRVGGGYTFYHQELRDYLAARWGGGDAGRQ
jgi:hypothetical protein